jgi:hypothetical protein
MPPAARLHAGSLNQVLHCSQRDRYALSLKRAIFITRIDAGSYAGMLRAKRM